MKEHHAPLRRIGRIVVLLVGVLSFVIAPVPRMRVAAQEADPTTVPADAAGPEAAASSYRTFLPQIAVSPYSEGRFGYGIHSGVYENFPAAPSLRANWYMNWWVRTDPAWRSDVEYVQTVRVHQKLTCPLFSPNAHDRTLCPYVVPHEYLISPALNTIEVAIRANPGSLWLIGNEMDRRDWPGGGQDEMLPELYAVAYHDLYMFIKQRDPTARVAIGGVIQGTPLRIEYVDKVWNTYQAIYQTRMPVDVWNVHGFILREARNSYGADIPPGSDAQTGAYVGMDDSYTHTNTVLLRDQTVAFRRWMKEHGEQQKPLIVSEYGVLYTHGGMDSLNRVRSFMLETFDFFLSYKDCELGYAKDYCRLVQRWAWYSLNDMGATSGTNPYGALINPTTQQLTGTGTAYRDYAASHQGQ